MITLITGKESTGKTRKARQLTKGKNTIWLDEKSLESPFCFNCVDKNTEYIIFDEINNKETIIKFIDSYKLKIEKQYQDSEIIDIPNIIFISKTLNIQDFTNKNIKIIKKI